MNFRKVLITGGAGFVGSRLGLLLKQHFGDIEVIALDNLKRRGSELNLPQLQASGIEFVHGDTRSQSDLEDAGKFDLLIDCAAEPSVQAGLTGSPKPVFDVNLNGTINCLEAARRWDAAFLFLSTSRVYPIRALNEIPVVETESRYEWTDDNSIPGASSLGISEDFPLTGTRSYYGASKLASELIAQEYASIAKMPVMINRCGVLTGPWQMGKVDQGVVALWVLRHHFNQPLKYMGFGGTGRQVRDILHVNDLFSLLVSQMEQTETWDGRVYNVGGGRETSVSLCELTEICHEVTEQQIEIGSVHETNDIDLRIYLTDSSRVRDDFQWTPKLSTEHIVRDIHNWVCDNESQLQAIVG